MENNKCNKGCERCTFPCTNNGEKLIPVTYEELRKMGYIICDDFTTIPVENQE